MHYNILMPVSINKCGRLRKRSRTQLYDDSPLFKLASKTGSFLLLCFRILNFPHPDALCLRVYIPRSVLGFGNSPFSAPKHAKHKPKQVDIVPTRPCGFNCWLPVPVVPGCGAGGRGHHHRLFLLLPRSQELSNHGLLQEDGATGEQMCFGVSCHLGAFRINKLSPK